MLCIKNATIHTATNADPRVRTLVGDILIDGGKILEVGSGLHPDADCTDRWRRWLPIPEIRKRSPGTKKW